MTVPGVLAPLVDQPGAAALVTDFDGTLAPIVDDPTRARPVPTAVRALEALARSLAVVGVVSGRPVEFLRAPLPADGLALVGQYGLERLVDGHIVVDERAEPSTAAWVADNLEAVADAVAGARDDGLVVEDLHRWHRRLMVHSRLPHESRGAFRTAQGWIGGSSPLNAVYVPPPPESIGNLMDDLVLFASRSDIDPVTQAAVLHAQFETIHPYGDGNGRIGRVLIARTIVHRMNATPRRRSAC